MSNFEEIVEIILKTFFKTSLFILEKERERPETGDAQGKGENFKQTPH